MSLAYSSVHLWDDKVVEDLSILILLLWTDNCASITLISLRSDQTASINLKYGILRNGEPFNDLWLIIVIREFELAYFNFEKSCPLDFFLRHDSPTQRQIHEWMSHHLNEIIKCLVWLLHHDRHRHMPRYYSSGCSPSNVHRIVVCCLLACRSDSIGMD